MRGRLSGCAILPISRRTASRGSLVSASSVTTYRTSAGTSVVLKLVSVAPRSSRFSSCSFPRLRSHPSQHNSLAFQTPLSVQHQKARTMALIKPRDAIGRGLKEGGVAGGVFRGGIDPVGQEGEMKLAFRTGEVMHFQAGDLCVDFVRRGQHHRHHDERSKFRRNAVAQFQGGKECSLQRPI